MQVSMVKVFLSAFEYVSADIKSRSHIQGKNKLAGKEQIFKANTALNLCIMRSFLLCIGENCLLWIGIEAENWSLFEALPPVSRYKLLSPFSQNIPLFPLFLYCKITVGFLLKTFMPVLGEVEACVPQTPGLFVPSLHAFRRHPISF